MRSDGIFDGMVYLEAILECHLLILFQLVLQTPHLLLPLLQLVQHVLVLGTQSSRHFPLLLPLLLPRSLCPLELRP